MPTLSEIKTGDWSLSIKQQGAIVEDLLDIDQAYRIIFTTQRGSDPTRPTFGVDLFGHLDKPINTVVQSIIPDMIDQGARWETRGTLKSVTGSVSSDGSILTMEYTWKYFSETFTTILKYGITQ